MGKQSFIPSDVTTPGGRVKWLMESRYENRPALMANGTGVSLTGIIKVVTGQQQPGRRLLETIVKNAKVNPAWLFAGDGQPFKGSALPVADKCLPGSPADHSDLLTKEEVPEVAEVYSPTRYWLKLKKSDVVVKVSGNQLMAGDFLLMETNREKFPPMAQRDDRWAVVRMRSREGPRVQLARLEYFPESDESSAHLCVDTFEQFQNVIHRIVIDEMPGGEIETSKHTMYLEPGKESPAAKLSRQPWPTTSLELRVRDEDLIAICVLIVRRFV